MPNLNDRKADRCDFPSVRDNLKWPARDKTARGSLIVILISQRAVVDVVFVFGNYQLEEISFAVGN